MHVDNLKATRKIVELEYIAHSRLEKIKGSEHPTEGNKEEEREQRKSMKNENTRNNFQ